MPQADLIADDMIKQAELGWARIYETPGELQFSDELRGVTHKIPHMTLDLNSEYVHSAMVDENYLVLRSHIDDGTKQKIARGEYVNFAKLLPKDRILTLEEPQRLEMMTKDGHVFWMPVSDHTKINGFGRWEQAFRIFSNIYSKAHPHRSSELLQYSHLIHTASLTYVWDNVYRYDVDFCLHMAMFPSRSWAIILQQAWSLPLKDRVRYGAGVSNSNAMTNFDGSHAKNSDGWGQYMQEI